MLKKPIYIFLTLQALLTLQTIYAQSITWQRTYGTTHINEGYSIVQTPDGGYIGVGRDRIGQIEKAWVLRLNQFGDTIWTKFIMDDLPLKIISTNDNNYVIMGQFSTIIKIDINGNIIWQSGPYDFDKTFISIKQTTDNGYIICGRIEMAFRDYPYLFKINASGDSIWERIYTDSIFFGRFYDVTISNDNNFVMAGNISDSSVITDKLSVMKTDQLGNTIWLRRYDTLQYYQTRAIKTTSDGSFIIAGNFFYCKVNDLGNMIWFKLYMPNYYVNLMSVALTNDNNYIFTGTWDTIGNSTFYTLLFKTDTSGNELWHKSFGFNDADRGNEVKQTSDSGYIIIGRRDGFQAGDIYIIKTDKNGYAQPYIGINPISTTIPQTFQLHQNYPNPFNPSTAIRFDISATSLVSITIYDILGREVFALSEHKNAGSYELKFDGSDLASGLYFCRFTADGFTDTKKMILLK